MSEPNTGSNMETFKSILANTPKKDKIMNLIQCILSIVIIVTAILGYNGIGNTKVIDLVDLGLLTILLIISSIRNFKTRKMFTLIYIALACVILYVLFRSVLG